MVVVALGEGLSLTVPLAEGVLLGERPEVGLALSEGEALFESLAEGVMLALRLVEAEEEAEGLAEAEAEGIGTHSVFPASGWVLGPHSTQGSNPPMDTLLPLQAIQLPWYGT